MPLSVIQYMKSTILVNQSIKSTVIQPVCRVRHLMIPLNILNGVGTGGKHWIFWTDWVPVQYFERTWYRWNILNGLGTGGIFSTDWVSVEYFERTGYRWNILKGLGTGGIFSTDWVPVAYSQRTGYRWHILNGFAFKCWRWFDGYRLSQCRSPGKHLSCTNFKQTHRRTHARMHTHICFKNTDFALRTQTSLWEYTLWEHRLHFENNHSRAGLCAFTLPHWIKSASQTLPPLGERLCVCVCGGGGGGIVESRGRITEKLMINCLHYKIPCNRLKHCEACLKCSCKSATKGS